MGIFARIFAALTEGKRGPVEGPEEMTAFGADAGGFSLSVNGKIDGSKTAPAGILRQQDAEGNKRDVKHLDSHAPGAAYRLRQQAVLPRQPEVPKNPADEPNPSAPTKADAETSGNHMVSGDVQETSGHSSTKAGGIAARGRSRTRKSIVDFIAETSGIQQTSLQAERSESYSAAARLLAELKKEARCADDQHPRSAKSLDRAAPPKDKLQRQNLSQVSKCKPNVALQALCRIKCSISRCSKYHEVSHNCGFSRLQPEVAELLLAQSLWSKPRPL